MLSESYYNYLGMETLLVNAGVHLSTSTYLTRNESTIRIVHYLCDFHINISEHKIMILNRNNLLYHSIYAQDLTDRFLSSAGR
jgi:hypothetical protein